MGEEIDKFGGCLNAEARPAPTGDEFELVVSLGGLCQVAYQIEHWFGYRFNSPFDWLVTPLEAIAKVLDDDGGSFSKKVRVMFNGETAVCCYYGVAYQHEYLRDANRFVQIDVDALVASQSKMRHKYNKLKDRLSSGPKTLFIRMGGHHDSAYPLPYVADPRPTTTTDLNALCAALGAKFPELSFELAFVYLERFTTLDVDPDKLDRRVKVFALLDDDGSEWTGRMASWAPVFNAYPFRLSKEEIAQQFVGQKQQELLIG
jgi:hypothetical protein